jgi:hypothetical protein
MKFYLALDSEGRKQLRGTQDDIKLVNRKDFEVVDIPTDKAGLMALVQDSFNAIFALEQQLKGVTPDATVDTSDIPEAGEEFFETATLRLPSALPAPAAPEPGEASLSARDRKEPCPRCKLNIDQARNHVATWLKLAQQDAIEAFVLDADWALLGTIAGNVAFRFQKMAEQKDQ